MILFKSKYHNSKGKITVIWKKVQKMARDFLCLGNREFEDTRIIPLSKSKFVWCYLEVFDEIKTMTIDDL